MLRRSAVAKGAGETGEAAAAPPPAAPRLAVHEDIFSLMHKVEHKAKAELAGVAVARPSLEHRVDNWADTMLAATEHTVETQLASNTNVHLHMKGFITDLADEAERMDEELHERLAEATKPRPAPVVLEHRIRPPPPDTRTEWEKIEDKSDAELAEAVVASKASAIKGVEDVEGKYTKDRQKKYWDLSDQVYKLEASMRKIAPTLKQAKTTLEFSKGDMTAQHQELRDTVDHVERLSRTARKAVASVKEIGVAFNKE